MRRKRRRGIGPVGTIVLIWVFFAFILPVLRLSGGLIAAGLAVIANGWACPIGRTRRSAAGSTS